MRATTIHAARDIRLSTVPDPQVLRPTDAVVKVVRTCICGSDLWPYRGENAVTPGNRIGHEFIGTVESVGDEVSDLAVGDFVISPFSWGDNTCPVCQSGVNTSCLNGGWFGSTDRDGLPVDGCQGEYIRVPQAAGTLVKVPQTPGEDRYADLLTLSDVMGTGWHCAGSAGVLPGDRVAVIGDGAVGLSAVIAAASMGASMVVAMSRHEPRQVLAREFGATQIVAERGEQGVSAVKKLTEGLGVDVALECVGTDAAMRQAIDVTRPGGRVGYVGVPHGVQIPMSKLFADNISLAGGVASVRQYIPELLDKVLADEIRPGKVFDRELSLDEVAEGYAAMDERRAVKVMLQP